MSVDGRAHRRVPRRAIADGKRRARARDGDFDWDGMDAALDAYLRAVSAERFLADLRDAGATVDVVPPLAKA